MTDAALFALLALVSAFCTRLMIRRGVLDVPGRRSSHDRPIPKGGGIGIASAFLLGLLILATTREPGADPVPVLGLAAASTLVAAVSWMDDVRQFGFVWKLLAQAGAAAILTASGFVLRAVGPLPLGPFGWPLTIVLVLFVTNAVNFIDGLNGLASGSALVVALASWAAAHHAGVPLVAASGFSLAAGIAGFLPFNYPRARIFMGDVGSQLCGLVLSAVILAAPPLLPGGWGMAIPILGLLPILLDVAFTLARRLVAGDRLTEAHRGHLYQLAFRAGLPFTTVTGIYWVLAAEGCAMAWSGGHVGDRRALLAASGLSLGLALAAAAASLALARRRPIGKW